MNKDIINSKEIEIPIVFHNYKLLKDKEFILKGSNIYFVQGPNGVGKTSFLKALTSVQIAKDDTPEKVTRGEEEGYFEISLPAATGEIITLRHEFTNEKSKFIAIDSAGNKISSVTDIRALFNYTPINVSEFFAMSKSAEGRRKQRDIILKLLPDNVREDFNQLDLQEEHYYTTRTEVNQNLKTAKSNVSSIVIVNEDEALIPRKEEAEKLLNVYENLSEFRKDLLTQKADFEATAKYILSLESQLESLHQQQKTRLQTIKNIEDATLPYATLSTEDINAKITTGKTVINKIVSVQSKLELQKEWMHKSERLFTDAEKLTKEIDALREKKTEIITNSDLPVNNISFEEGYLTIDGFQFNENQVCESDAVLILANILAKINPGPVQIIGDASILDNEKLQMLNEIAEKNNKIMFVDEVVRTKHEMVVVGYEDIVVDALNNGLELVAKVKDKKGKKKSNYTILDTIDAHYEEAKDDFGPTLEKLDDEEPKHTDKPLF